ncbi:MAG: SurA N-terminal domain-containing protein [Alphaproteobacteria bacterium]
MRKVTRGWIAGILLGALVVAFAIWGIPHDVLNFGSPNAVASGDGVKVTAAEYKREYDAALEDYTRQSGGKALTPDEARAQGVDKIVLERVVTQAALERLAEKMGFHASDAMVAKQIRSEQAFRSQLTKKFDRTTYERLLQQNGMTPEIFETRLRSDLRRTQLAMPLSVGGYAPKSFAKLIYTYETEQRTIAAAGIPPTIIGKPPTPSEADLQTFYKENQARFGTPEYRAVTLVVARPELFAARVEVPEEKIKETYEFRKGGLGGGEKRSFVQISAPSKEAATEAARRLAAGEDPQKVAAALKLQVVPFENVAKTQVVDPALADAVFSLKEGQTTGAVQGKLAWAAARVTKIVAGDAPTYESMHDSLRAELAHEEAENALNDAVQKFDDERSGGKSMEDAARANNLLAVPYAKVDAQGRDAGGAPIQGIADNPDLLKTINATAVNESSDFMPIPNGGGFVLARVDAVIPAGVRTFAEVRPMLALGWQAQKTAEALRKASDAFLADMKAGKPFADTVRARHFVLITDSQTVTRQSIGSSPLASLGGAIFAANEGETVAGPDARGQAMIVVQVKKIDRPDPATNAALFAQAQKAAANFVDTDLLTAVQQSAVRAAKVKTNEPLRLQALGFTEPENNETP